MMACEANTMRKDMNKRLGMTLATEICATALLALHLPFAEAGASEAPQIPSLDWEARSDWTNVKTPQTWHGTKAVGDGVADDTSAIQLAIGAAAVKGGTVYLPPGTYRITDTLLLGTLRQDSEARPQGFSLIGCGRMTVVRWDGPDDAPMLRLLGLLQSRIVGIEFDAAGKASACLDMGGPAFQSHNLFRHCAFRGASFAAIDSGRRKMNTACTEQRIENCLFEKCGIGVALLDFNDYDCMIAGCEFRDCGVGIKTFKGNFYCRDTHFEGNTTSDFVVCSEHTSTIRRCTSRDSFRFLVQENPNNSTVMQDCHVAGWKARDGAVRQNIVPALMFDCVFEDSAKAGPAIVFAHTESEAWSGSNLADEPFKLISANCAFDGIRGERQSYDFSAPSRWPASGLTPDTSFLKTRAICAVRTAEPHTACIPGKIFDVKRDFGAKGGEADDTAAFRAAIAAAKAHGRGAMVYLPHGHYTVTETLELDGDDWFFGGSGTATSLSWYGGQDGVPLHVASPKSLGVIDIEIIRHGGRRDGRDILHTGGRGDSFTLYDNVRVHGWLIREADKRGILFQGLGKGDVVHSLATYGNMTYDNCAAATVLVDAHYEGTQRVKGANPDRSGITAYQFALLEICDPCLWVSENNSLVMTDFYNEQCTTLYRFEGASAFPKGRISLGSIKVEARPRIVSGWQGTIVLGTPQYYKNTLNGVSVWETDSRASVDYLELGGYYFVHTLKWPEDGTFRAEFVGTGGSPANVEGAADFRRRMNSPDPSAPGLKARALSFLEDMRRVGALDLELNFPNVTTH